jgi:hypothetical protein
MQRDRSTHEVTGPERTSEPGRRDRREENISHYIDTQHAQKRGIGGLSGRQLVEIFTGVAVVVALVVAAYAYVNTAEPVSNSGTAAGSATLTRVAHSALDPFEMR